MKDFLQEQIVHIVMGITYEHRLRSIYKFIKHFTQKS